MEECAFALEDSNRDDNNPLSGELKSNLSFKNLSSVASLEVSFGVEHGSLMVIFKYLAQYLCRLGSVKFCYVPSMDTKFK